MLRYYKNVGNIGTGQQPTLQDGEVRVSKLPKASDIGITTVNDSIGTDNYEDDLLYLYQNNFRATIFDSVDRTNALDYFNTGLIDFGIYTADPMPAQLQADPPNYTALDTAIGLVSASNGGRTPTVMSYRTGITTYSGLLYERFWGGRNSQTENTGCPSTNIDTIQYDNLGRSDIINRPTTNRWLYYSEMNASGGSPNIDFNCGSQAQGEADYTIKVAKALSVQGFHLSFGHWRWADTDYFKRFLVKMRALVGSNRSYSATFTEYAEYYFVRESVTKLSRSGLVVTINYKKHDISRPYNLISTLLWFEVNTIGTALEGLPIQTDVSSQIIKLSENNFSIGVDLNYNNTSLVITLSEAADETDYNNENIPVVSVNTGTGLITSDQPINYTLFRKTKAQNEWEVVIREFEDTFSAGHTIADTLDTVTYDYYLGFGNEFKQFGRIQF